MTADELKGVLPYMRSMLSRALDGRELDGECVDPDAQNGLKAPYWLHRARATGPRPVVFEIHGGGFALGDARKEDALCAWIRDAFDAHVVGIEYRLAPEHPFPAAVEDVLACVNHALALLGPNADRSRLYALGYSAGATLACSYALTAPARGLPQFAAMALHYPCVDVSRAPDPSKVRACDLPVDMMGAFSELYAGSGTDLENPLASPARAPHELLESMPPVDFWPVHGDALLPQAAAFCGMLREAGVSCRWHEVEGAYHGYIEDAADPVADAAVTMPETIAARPAGWRAAAWASARESMEELLGPAVNDVPYPGL